MASFNGSFDGRTTWALQTKGRASVPHQTPSAQSSAMFGGTASSSGGSWVGWTNVPPVGTHDPYIADQTRPLLRGAASGLTGPTSSPAPEPWGGGKRIVGPHHSQMSPAGKRAYPELVGRVSSGTPKPSGLKYVHSRARHEHAVLADPNSAVEATKFKPESVKMFDGFNQVNYRCWQPHELNKAEKGDWNWNNALGFRKVKMTDEGLPRRSLESPVAWPGYVGYPPERDASGASIDYGLKLNGRNGGFTLKTQNADVLESRRNRAAASNTRITGAMSQTAPPTLYKRGTY